MKTVADTVTSTPGKETRETAKEFAECLSFFSNIFNSEVWCDYSAQSTEFSEWLCHRRELNISLTAGGASAASHGGRPNGDPAGAVPVAERSEACGIESRDDAPRRMAMRHPGERGAVKCLAEQSRLKRSFTKAQAGRPWIHDVFRPCGTQAPLRQGIVPACAGVKRYAPRNAINTVL